MKSKVPGYTTNQGFAIMMEHLSPGKGGRHRQTMSYGKRPNLNLSPRELKEFLKQKNVLHSAGLTNLYGACADIDFATDELGISPDNNDLIGVFDNVCECYLS